jgi:hypothetical protein
MSHSDWIALLKWGTPSALIVAGVLWWFARPALSNLIISLLKSAHARHGELLRAQLAPEFEMLDDHGNRLTSIERMIIEQNDRLMAFESSLLAQGKTLAHEIQSVFGPLNVTLERMSSSLDRISEATNANAVAIGELRGMWDGAERRTYTRRRPEK